MNRLPRRGDSAAEGPLGQAKAKLPLVDQSADMTSLVRREGVTRHDAPGLVRVAVLDRSFEPFAKRVWLSQLTTEPAHQADLGRTRY
jgi:hypothetical protein